MINNVKTNGIVLIYPPVSLTGRYKKISSGHEVAPQPLICLASVLRQNGFGCHIIDANALGLSVDDVVSRVLDLNVKYVGISSPTMLISTSANISSRLKEKNPMITTIIGGPHITAVPRETMSRYHDIDIGVLGEGEETIVELLNFLNENKGLGGVKGIVYRDKDSLKFTPSRPFIKDLDVFPFPAWDMLPDLLEYYQQSVARIGRLPNISIISSRGCPFKCIFCARNVFGNITRAYSADYIIRMIKFLIDKYKIKSVSFEDENFVIYRKRLIEFCNRIIDEKIDITWDCASSVSAVNPEMLSLMKKAGCWQINYGIESGSQRVLDFIKKGTTLEKVRDTLKITKDAGMYTKGYFIIGHPTETYESIQETIDYTKKIKLDFFQMSFMIPFPGTEFYDMAQDYGSFENDWDNMNIWTSLFIPNGFKKGDLERESKRAYREFYFRPAPILAFLRRMLKFSMLRKFLKDGFRILRFLVSRDEAVK